MIKTKIPLECDGMYFGRQVPPQVGIYLPNYMASYNRSS